MSNKETKRNIKAVIVRIAVALLVVIALLTYFSSTIDSYLLPHVTVTYGGEGTLKHSLHTPATLESAVSEKTGETVTRFRFECARELNDFVQMGATVNFKASVEAADDEFVYRDGVAVIVGKRETEEGVECTAELRDMELLSNEEMPVAGDMIVVDTVFETPKYGHVVMKSAIQDGSYVYLVAKEKDDKRYVKLTPVTVIAESDFYAAVELDGDQLPFVLTATKAIGDGQRVIVDG